MNHGRKPTKKHKNICGGQRNRIHHLVAPFLVSLSFGLQGVFGFSWNETVHAGYHGGIFLHHSRHPMDGSACAAYRDSDNVFFALEEGRRSRHVSLRQLYILWRQLVYGGGHGVQHIFLRSDVLQCGFASG